MSRKERAKWSNFAFLKRRKEDPHLVANGRRRFSCSNANGGRRRRFFFTFSHFSPKQLYLDLRLFPFILRFYFIDFRPLFTSFLPFPWDVRNSCTPSTWRYALTKPTWEWNYHVVIVWQIKVVQCNVMKFIRNLLCCVHLEDTKTLWENHNSPWGNVKEHYVDVHSMFMLDGWTSFVPFVITSSYNLLI